VQLFYHHKSVLWGIHCVVCVVLYSAGLNKKQQHLDDDDDVNNE